MKPEIANIYLNFKGTLSLKGYWLYWNLPFLLLAIIDYSLVKNGITLESKFFQIVNLLIIWPFLAISIKRLHDLGKSGWWVLINLIPVIGSAIFWLILSFMPGEKAINNYYKKKI